MYDDGSDTNLWDFLMFLMTTDRRSQYSSGGVVGGLRPGDYRYPVPYNPYNPGGAPGGYGTVIPPPPPAPRPPPR